MSDETYQHEWDPDGCAPLRGISLPPPPAKSILLRRFPMFRLPISYPYSGAYDRSLACADRWCIYTFEKMTPRLLVLISLVCITIFCAGLLCFLVILRKRRIRRTHLRQALQASGPQHWRSTYPAKNTGLSTSMTGDLQTLEGRQFLGSGQWPPAMLFKTGVGGTAVPRSILRLSGDRTQLRRRNVGRGRVSNSSRSSDLTGAEDPPAQDRVGTGLNRRLVTKEGRQGKVTVIVHSR